MKFRSLLPLFLAPLFLFAACADESPVDAPRPSDALGTPDIEEYKTPAVRAIEAELAQLEVFDPAVSDDEVLGRHFGFGLHGAVNVPAGSVDALAAAIAEAGPGGVVRLARGLHTESSTIEITFPVTILGRRGAVLEVASLPYPDSELLDAAFHIRGANVGRASVTIAGLEIRPVGDIGGVGILVENTAHVAIAYNSILDHQDGVFLQRADDARILGNEIVVNAANPDHGILAVNGKRVAVSGNVVSGGFFGLWACDEDGYAAGNEFFDNLLIGLIYCKVPMGYLLPDGTDANSDLPATRWFGAFNRSHDNTWGYMIVDGSNNSVLAFNAASNNAAYDVHVVPETEVLFGFCTPQTFDNTVITADSDDLIKDCGIDTTVIGGTLVDTSVDPCEPACGAAKMGAASATLQRGDVGRLMEFLAR